MPGSGLYVFIFHLQSENTMGIETFKDQRQASSTTPMVLADRKLLWDDDPIGPRTVDDIDRQPRLRVARAMPNQRVVDFPQRLDWSDYD